MRRLLFLVLASTAALGLMAGCSSDGETSTAASSSTAVSLPAGGGGLGGGGGGGGVSSSLAPSTTVPLSPGCKAVRTFLYSNVIAGQAEEIEQEQRDKVSQTLETSGNSLKQENPELSTDVDVRIAYAKKLLAGEDVSDLETSAAEGALNSINNYRTAECPVGLGGAGGLDPNATTTTAP